jgi:tetratricopeptide (TPR) repeat protein
VFVDGRLEVYDTAFVTDYTMALTDPPRWQADADRYQVQTAIVFHRFETERTLAGRLSKDKLWTLVYVDEVAAVFVRTQGNDAAIARAASVRAAWSERTEAWLSRPAPKFYSAGRVEGTRAYARVLATIGLAEPAITAYSKLFELGIPAREEVERRLLVMRYLAAHGRSAEAQEQARRILALAPDNAEARALSGRAPD